MPKSHWVLHLPRQLLDHGALLSTFLMELKHRTTKRYAEPRHNTTSFERGLMTEIAVQHLWELESHAVLGVDLVEPQPAKPRMVTMLCEHFGIQTAEILTSATAYVHCTCVQIGNIIAFFGESGELAFGEVFFHARIDGVMWSCISVWTILELKVSAVRCQVEDAPRLVGTECLVEPCVAFKASVGQVSHVILPPKLQALRRSR